MKSKLLALSVLASLTVHAAHAAVYFDSINVSSPDANSDGNYDGVTAMADSFTAGTPDFSQVTLGVGLSTAGTAGSTMVFLVPDTNTGSAGVAGAPELSLSSGNFVSFAGAIQIGTILDTSLSTTPSNVTLSINPATALAASTAAVNDEYWIALVPSSTSSLEWLYGDSTTSSETGQESFYAYSSGGYGVADDTGGSANSPAYDMMIATPEPASLTVLGASLLGLGYFRRRRSTKV